MRTALTALALAVAAAPAVAQPPQRLGTCSASTIKTIGDRFGDKLVKPKADDIDNGTAIALADGTYGVSYSFVEPIHRSRVGDKVIACLIAVPQGCPKGDERGKTYTTTNLRTLEAWVLPDSPHSCGGA